jgi:hypothetical protein
MATTPANTFLTIGMITRRALMVLENNLTFTKYVNREYIDAFAVAGAKIGTILNLRIPPQFLVNTSGPVLTNPNLVPVIEGQFPLVLNNQHHIDMAFTSQDLTLSIDDFSDRIIQPAIAALANEIDRRGLLLYLNVANAVAAVGGGFASGVGYPPGSTNTGTVDTSGNTLFGYGQAYVHMDNEATPRDNLRSTVISPNAQNYAVAGLSGLFQSSTDIAEQYRSGNMGFSGGSKYSMDQNVAVQAFGPLGGTATLSTAPTQGGTTAVISWAGVGNGVVPMNPGDVFTMGSIASSTGIQVNPQSRQPVGYLRQFVVVSTTPVATLLSTVTFSPPIWGPGAAPGEPRQNVNALPLNGGPVTPFAPASATAAQSMAFHRDAFTVASVDLEMPGGVDMAARVASKRLGFSMRLVRQYDINNDNFPCRISKINDLQGFSNKKRILNNPCSVNEKTSVPMAA